MQIAAKDLKGYSITKIIRSLMNHEKVSGLEAEVSSQIENESGSRAEGCHVPLEMLARRDLNVTSASQGGSFVETTITPEIISLLSNSVSILRLGATRLSGLRSNISIPRQTAAATAYSLAESATLTKSTPAIDQVSLTPRRVSCGTDLTRQLLLQSSVDVENFVRADIMQRINIKIDRLAITGTGSDSEPTGLMHQGGVGSVTFGATPTYAKMVAFETALSSGNADRGKMSYLTTPATKAALKTATKVASSTFPIYIWEPGNFNDDSNDGMVNGYRAAASNNVPGNQVIFGNFQDLIVGFFGGVDLIVNPYSRASEAIISIVAHIFFDVALAHAPSFCISSDAGTL
jgi:HK97 family phage major capsid protein